MNAFEVIKTIYIITCSIYKMHLFLLKLQLHALKCLFLQFASDKQCFEVKSHSLRGIKKKKLRSRAQYLKQGFKCI